MRHAETSVAFKKNQPAEGRGLESSPCGLFLGSFYLPMVITYLHCGGWRMGGGETVPGDLVLYCKGVS